MQSLANKQKPNYCFANGAAGLGVAFSTGELWTPAALTTSLWLDAADDTTITLNSGNVSAWNDKSGNARHFSQATAGSQPLYATATLNGLNVITPNADGEELVINAVLQPRALFFVYATESGYTDATGKFLIGDNVGQGRAYHYHGGYIGSALFSDVYAVALQGSAETRVNGSSIAPFSINKTTDFSILSIKQVNSETYNLSSFGSDTGDNSRSWRGSYAEIITLANNATQTETDLIEGYLAWKWDLVSSLPNDHPYKNSAPTL